jgi:O-antigen/teichoic acid export membrane protein
LELLRYKGKAFAALTVKSLPLLYGAAVILFVNTRLPRESELGVYSLAIATFFAASLLGKSFALYPLIKFLSEGKAEPGVWRAGASFWTATQIGAAAIIWILAPLAPGIFHAPGLDEGMRWAAVILLVFIPRDLAAALLMSSRDMSRLFVLEGCYFAVAAGGIAYLALTGNLSAARQVLALNLAAGALSTLAAPFLCASRLPKWEKGAPGTWPKMARYGRDSLGIGVGDMAYTQLDYHLLGYFLGPAEVALYFAAKNFFRFYNAITQAINLLVFPTSSNLHSRGETQKLKELIEKILGGYLGFLLIVNALVVIGADWIVSLAYRGIFPDAANVLRIFALASFFEPLYMVSENVLYGIGRPRAVLVAMWSSIALFLILSFILMPNFGAIGGALTICGTLCSLAAITLFYLNRELQVTPLSIARRTVAVCRALLGRS